MTAPNLSHGDMRPILSVERIGNTEDGRGIWLVDFGQNCSQRIRLHMRDLEAGQSVTLRHVEVLEPDGSIATRTLRRGQQLSLIHISGRAAPVRSTGCLTATRAR